MDAHTADEVISIGGDECVDGTGRRRRGKVGGGG